MGVELAERLGVESAPPGVRALREAALNFYLSTEVPPDINIQAGRPEREAVLVDDPFDNARIIAWHGENLPTDVRRHMDLQRATKMTESLGAFDNQVKIPLVEGWLTSFGERETRTRLRGILAAFALEQTDRGFKPYLQRTLYENHHKHNEQAMMSDESVPLGTAKVLVSPCEPGVYGRRLGMFPEREMAVLQISWKCAAEEMILRSVSLDRASLTILRQMLLENGIVVAEDAEPQDYLAYVIPQYFNNQLEQDAFVKRFVGRFDELVIKENPELSEVPKQGVVGYDARRLHNTAESITETHPGQLALSQIHKFDQLLSKNAIKPHPLDDQVRDLAESCISGRRSDGSRLLTSIEAGKIQTLLKAENVYLEDPDQGFAIKLVIEIHNSAVEESYRDFLAGDKKALNWMKGKKITVGKLADIINKAAIAIENGRGSGGCGNSGEIKSGLPDYKIFPKQYLIAKYGIENVVYGRCFGCGKDTWVAKCSPAFCGTCDGKRSSRR